MTILGYNKDTLDTVTTEDINERTMDFYNTNYAPAKIGDMEFDAGEVIKALDPLTFNSMRADLWENMVATGDYIADGAPYVDAVCEVCDKTLTEDEKTASFASVGSYICDQCMQEEF